MILVYDGASELFSRKRYPFAFEYSCKVFDYVNAHLEGNYVVDNTENICLGVENSEDYLGNWLSNIQSMYAIAQQRKMKFLVFCQPWLTTKKERTTKEKNIMLSMSGEVLDNMMKNALGNFIEQRSDISGYIHNLSHIFDGQDVSMDLCHVWEKGNRIIAEEIGKVIIPIIEKIRMEESNAYCICYSGICHGENVGWWIV